MDNRELLDKNFDELFYYIGEIQSEIGIFPIKRNEVIQKGKEWFENNLNNLKSKVCNSIVSEEIMKEANTIKILTSLADIISANYIGIPPFVVSALIIKIGLERFCSLSKIEV